MRRVLRYLKHHGLWRTIRRVAHTICSRALPYNKFAVMWMPTSFVHEPTEGASGWLEIRKLGQEEAFEVSQLPGTGMPEVYVQDALARGDEYFGATIEEEPACVCWYARRGPVALYRWWNVEFRGDYVYVHGAYTDPIHRGKRLLEQNLHAAAIHYKLTGATDMFALVECSNYASLSAFRRAGYTQRATIRTAKIGRHFFVRHNAECRNARVCVTPRSNPDAAKRSSEDISRAA